MPNGQYVPMGEAYVPEVPVTEAPTGEAPSYVYDYTTGQWVLATPEEVAKREAWYGQLKGERGVIEAPLPLAVSQYIDDVMGYVNYYQRVGNITQTQAEAYLQAVETHILDYGLSSKTPYYKEVMQWREYQAQEAETKVGLTQEQLYEKAQEEARRGTERETVRARVMRESAPRDPDYLAKKAAILANPDFSYQEKVYVQLRALTKQLQAQYGLNDMVTNDLYQQANFEAFEQLPPEYQQWYQLGGGGGAVETLRRGIPEPREPTPAEPQYWSAFEAMGAGPQPWRRWFESNYSSLLAQYKLAFPEERPVKEEEKGWAEWLAQKTPKLREEWGALSPYARGEYPGRYAPSIRTVRW